MRAVSLHGDKGEGGVRAWVIPREPVQPQLRRAGVSRRPDMFVYLYGTYPRLVSRAQGLAAQATPRQQTRTVVVPHQKTWAAERVPGAQVSQAAHNRQGVRKVMVEGRATQN